jgi:DNA-binding transcriptional ArsR family regulator
VFAVQREMSEGHFFLDKAERFELEPLRPERMVEVYVRRFEGSEPFDGEALLKLARMSRGIFRRFLRYIVLSLDLWEHTPEASEVIDVGLVSRAVSVGRLVEDMELELCTLFPKNSDLRFLAVRLIMLLEQRGELKQSELEELLDVKDYALSRLLVKLEEARYVVRRREGNDKVVGLRTQGLVPDESGKRLVSM